ncbi:hypothetical protein V492_03851 [Pseudogymnoascus sp. VKM F-4246]|nr:hypothetical protein V492_03851 [Pseudogymnoascus sp. VKM F-4246]
MTVSKHFRVGATPLLFLTAFNFCAYASFKCDADDSGPGTAYNASSKYLGCYDDPHVSILSDAKLSTIAMTPQFCANWCGQRGFAHGGIEFGTQCFCGSTPNLSQATKVDDSRCSSKCTTEPSSSCGATYVMSLYEILNPEGNATNTGFIPACQTQPLCSQKVCDTSISIAERVKSLVSSLTLEEKVLNVVDASAGSTRLGLPPYEWWSEGTHGVGSAPGVQFTNPPANFSYATSFPSPILTAASFDDALMAEIAAVIGKEGRAFGNNGFSGYDFWAPNINPFRDPRWGRGQETPGEDVFHVQSYTRSLVQGLQGDDPDDKQVIATCKHYAAYDLETGRHGNNYNPTQQDLADYYLAPFKTCVRDSAVGSIMCSYNAVDGIPTCASEYLLEEVLRKHWGFNADYHYVVSDCGAVADIFNHHNFTDTEEAAASVALNAGTDLDCGSSFVKLNESIDAGQTTVEALDRALTRLYSAMFTVGFFDGGKYSDLDFSDVSTPSAQSLAYEAAVKGMTLLKNDKLLPLGSSHKFKSVAVIGPFANATEQMQGDYSGTAPYLHSPLEAFEKHGWNVNYALGTEIDDESTDGFASALEAAKKSDLVVYLGGIDGSIENEENDRTSITWPGNQLDLISQLSKHSKHMIVVQFGAGQVDDSEILQNKKIDSLIWAGYPSQDGGPALVDIITGKRSIAGRLPITQYPASYADEVSMFNINLRPNKEAGFPGRTYKWYTGKPVLPFGHGLHYTKFDFKWKSTLDKVYDIRKLVDSLKKHPLDTVDDNTPFATIKAEVKNVGKENSDYVGLLFISSQNAGPAPRPNKSLVSYLRLNDIKTKSKQTLDLPLTLGSLARADEDGNLAIFPGDYKIALDISESLTFKFSLRGPPVVREIKCGRGVGYLSGNRFCMMAYLSRVTAVIAISVFGQVAAEVLKAPNSASNQWRIWDDEAGTTTAFTDQYVIGNGRIGAMFSGGQTSESININENSFWSGSFIDRINPDAQPTVKQMQQLVQQGNFSEAEELGKLGYIGTPMSTRNYDTLGTLGLTQTFPDGNVTNYERWIDIQEAVGGTYFSVGGITYQREYIASNPDDIIAINLKASQPGSLNFNIRLDRGAWDVVGLNRHVQYSTAVNGDSVVMGGQTADAGPLVWAAGARIVASGGQISTIGDNILCRGADEATVYFQAWTSYRKKDPRNAVLSDLAAISKSYNKIRTTHVSDYQAIAGRMSLDLGTSTPKQKSQTTPHRMANIAVDAFDPELASLYFQLGRFLLISSSRPSSNRALPPNLQGLWNNVADPPWGGKYTININLQMNYWPSLTTGLADLISPLNNLLKTMHSRGTKVAKEMYGCSGTVTHHNTDLWGDSAPQDNYAPATFWPMGATWMITHIIEHYRFTGDREFLGDMFPTLKANVEFALDFLTEYNGYMVANPSVSPENTYIIPNSNGKTASISLGTTIDNQLLWEVFGFIPEAQAALGIRDDKFAKRAAKMRAKLPGLRVNQYGGIAEWIHNYEEPPPSTRVGFVFPSHPFFILDLASNIMTLTGVNNGGGPCGWPRAWTVAMSGRMFLPEIAHERLVTQMSDCSWNKTMLNQGDVAPFQIDGNFGTPAGIVESFIQSHEYIKTGAHNHNSLEAAYTGELNKVTLIRLLPSVPAAWAANGGGSFKGMIARGGFKVDASWDSNGKLKAATIVSELGNSAYVTLGQASIGSSEGLGIKVSGHGLGVFVSLKGKKGTKFAVTAA